MVVLEQIASCFSYPTSLMMHLGILAIGAHCSVNRCLGFEALEERVSQWLGWLGHHDSIDFLGDSYL